MTFLFGDSFDFYATPSDAGLGYWDAAGTNFSLSAGRFTGSQAIASINTVNLGLQLGKSSGSNDATHHIVCAFQQTIILSGTALGEYIQLLDGTTGQCCIVFRTDGAILLTSGTPAGTVLATYTGAFPASAWTAFEFEITINNTTGAFHVRKNGNTADDFVATGLNTRVSANNYANKLQIGDQANLSSGAQKIDDVLWFNTSGAAPNTWVGDVRAYQLMPNGTASAQFAPSPSPVIVTPSGAGATASRGAGIGSMSQFIASFSGTIASASVSVNIGGTGNLKAAIYDATHSTVLATSNAVVNPVAGNNALTFSVPLTVVKGTTYYLAIDQDTTILYNTLSGSGTGLSFTTAYASFPAASPTTSVNSTPALVSLNITPTVNSEFVSEPQEDGAATYVFDSTVGQADFYTIAALPLTPASIVAVTTRGFMAKSDAGTRGGQVQLKSGATTVQSPALALGTSFLWNYRTDTVDPNNGLTWTAVGVNSIQIGPLVQA